MAKVKPKLQKTYAESKANSRHRRRRFDKLKKLFKATQIDFVFCKARRISYQRLLERRFYVGVVLIMSLDTQAKATQT